MQTIENSFSTVAQRIGYTLIGKLAGVTYQVVSTMASDPRPGHKRKVRKRILSATIEEAERRAAAMKQEAQELEKQVIELKQWREKEFGN